MLIRSRRIGIRTLCVVAALVALSAACSSDEEASLGSGSEGLNAVEGPAEPAEPLSEFEDLWTRYLVVYDEVMTDGGDGDSLEGIATDAVIEELEALGQANQQRVEDIEFDGIVEVASKVNLVSLDEDDQPVLTDCTTHTIRSVLGDPFDIFAAQEVTFEPGDDGDWVIANVAVVQDGWFGQDFGCVPGEVADEARRVAEVFQGYGLQMERDPSKPLPDGLGDVSSPEIVEALEFGRGELASLELYTDSEADVVQDLVGLNFQFASVEGPVVRIDSCVTYPEGQQLRAVDGGEIVQEGLPPGGSQGTSIDVIVRDGLVGEVIAVTPISNGVC